MKGMAATKIGLVRRGYSGTGGAERYLLRFAAALREARYEVMLFASKEWPRSMWEGELVRVAGESPLAFANTLKEIWPRDECDIVFSMERVWDCDVYRAGDGVHRAWLERRREYEPRWRAWVRSRQGKHRQLLELEEAVFGRGSRMIIANSRMVADEITRYFDVPTEKIRVVHNGLPAQEPHPERRTEVRRRLRIPEEDCAVLFAGSGWERKGLRFAMQAVNQTPCTTLLVAGSGRRHGLPESARTRFLGAVREMQELMEAADVFLLPTIYDPFSNASLEAMAAGLPVITTGANGFVEVMRAEVDGEVLDSPADLDAISAAIEKWMMRETPESREERREYARQYSIEANLQATVEAMAELRRV